MTLDQIRKLVEAATPGPWCAVGRTIYDEEGVEVFTVEADDNTLDQEDARFIAAARTLLPALLEVAEKAKVLCEEFADQVHPKDETPLVEALAALEALSQHP